MKRALVTLLSIPLLYFGLRLYFDLPPKLELNIDFFEQKKPLEFTDEELKKMHNVPNKNGNFIKRLCLKKYYRVRDQKLFEYCSENNLLNDNSGVCHHVGGVYNNNDLYDSLKYCGIDW